MYYGARYYHPTLGRFTQPDPVVIANTSRKEFAFALANPQLLNAYSYVGNNPLRYTDQTGEFAFLIPLGVYLAETAPIWVPIVVTGISSVAGAIVSAYYGQALGYYSAGASQNAEDAIGKEMITLEVMTTAVSGVMDFEEMVGGRKRNPKYSQQSERNRR